MILKVHIIFLFDKFKADFHLRITESIYQMHILQVSTLFHSSMIKLKDILKVQNDDTFVW